MMRRSQSSLLERKKVNTKPTKSQERQKVVKVRTVKRMHLWSATLSKSVVQWAAGSLIQGQLATCGSEKLFVELQPVKQPMEVTLGDGHVLKVAGQGVVSLKMKLPDGNVRRCKLLDVLYVPALAYNLLSVSKAAENGKVTKFDDDGCQILNSNRKVIAKGTRCGSLYYLDYKADLQANVVQQESKESVWHRRYGHLGVQNMQKLVRDNLVKGLDYDHSKEVGDVCEACIGGKLKKTPFQVSGSERAAEPLDLVHSDVCGKMNARTLGGAEYFLTFIDDCTIPKTPEQNGVAERLNRTLIEMVRSMLIDSKLPQKFWGEALST